MLMYVAWLQLQIEEKIPDAAFAVRPHHVTNVYQLLTRSPRLSFSVVCTLSALSPPLLSTPVYTLSSIRMHRALQRSIWSSIQSFRPQRGGCSICEE